MGIEQVLAAVRNGHIHGSGPNRLFGQLDAENYMVYYRRRLSVLHVLPGVPGAKMNSELRCFWQWSRRLTAWLSVAVFAAMVQPALQAQSAPVTIEVDAAAAAHPFPHFWEKMFGSGRAALSLRESYRHDLRETKKITDFEYVRFHAIFQDELGLYDEDKDGKPQYNFSYIDQIYDGVLENKVRPFIELSFMPKKLTSDVNAAACILVQAKRRAAEGLE